MIQLVQQWRRKADELLTAAEAEAMNGAITCLAAAEIYNACARELLDAINAAWGFPLETFEVTTNDANESGSSV